MMDEVQIDRDYLLQIAGDDKKLVMGIIDDFELESMGLITELSRLNEEYLLDVRDIFHKFRGASSSLGMVTLSEALVELEGVDVKYWSSGKVDLLFISECLTKSVALCKSSLA